MDLLASSSATKAFWLSIALHLPAAMAVCKRDCNVNSFPGPPNAGFETGDLSGWEVVSGDAFGPNSVSSGETYWDGPYRQEGSNFILGTAQSGEAAVGELRSASFQASSATSFLIGGGYDAENLYVALVRDDDGQILLKQNGANDEALIRIIWDTSQWAGQSVHIVVVDKSTSNSWGHINFDDLRVGCDALGDDELTFNVVGQANQPAKDDRDACELFAVDPMRPQFHYTQYQGWINDPAGLAQWKGKHHLFSQFYPDAPVWAHMHWAHAESEDAVHWRELPVALYPKPYSDSSDTSGRFTGSAVPDGDTLRLFLTDYTDLNFHPDEVQETVIIASSTDGINFEYHPDNPVVPHPPADAYSAIFRDPKVVWDDNDNSWKMVLSGEGQDGGVVYLYGSDDQISWSEVGAVLRGDEGGPQRPFWECPNLFPIGDKWALFYGDTNLGYYNIGSFNGSVLVSEKLGLLDHGPASYAMQWYKDEAGRNLAITWMANWPSPKWPSRVNGWAGQQSITRELFIREDGGLGSRPIPELDSLAASEATEHGPVSLDGVQEETLHLGSSNTARIKVVVDLEATTPTASLSLYLFRSQAEEVRLSYSVATRTLKLDTTKAGYAQAGTWQAEIAIPGDNKLSLDIFVDRSSLEIFAGDGTVMSALVWPKYQQSKGIDLVAEGKEGGSIVVFESVSLTPLGSSWC